MRSSCMTFMTIPATISGGALNTAAVAGGLSGGVPQNGVQLPPGATAVGIGRPYGYGAVLGAITGTAMKTTKVKLITRAMAAIVHPDTPTATLAARLLAP